MAEPYIQSNRNLCYIPILNQVGTSPTNYSMGKSVMYEVV